MPKNLKRKRILSNLFWIILIALFIIPQSRKFIQVRLHGLLSTVKSVEIIDEDERTKITDFDWKLRDESGDIINFNDFKGNVLVLNFWATWCPPCIAEMQSLENLYKAYNEKVTFLFITSDDMSLVQKFKDKKGYTFKVYNPLEAIPKELETRSIPRTFIVNKKGEIVVDESSALQWDSQKSHQLLNELIEE